MRLAATASRVKTSGVPTVTTFFGRLVVGLLCVSGGLALGCAGRNNNYDNGYPNEPGRTIIAEPGGYQDVYVADQTYSEQVVEGRQVVGYDTLSDGTRVEVVTYVHTYPDPLDTFPRVYWGGSWYYNVNGDFVYWSPAYGGWVYYWGPPAPLVSCWNVYYPWAPYYWGVGFYGAGWYWGGVGYYGYHAYGVPVVNEYHHHHHHWAGSSDGKPTGGHAGGPSDLPPSKGGPSDEGPARRTKPDQAPVAERTKPPANGPTADPARRSSPARSDQKGDRVAGAAPQRDPAKRTVPVRTYTNGSGQRVTTIDPQAGRIAATRNPTERTPKSLGTVQSGPARDPFATRNNTPRWDQPAASPSRDTSWDTRVPSRSATPSSQGRSAAPAPSRSFSPPSRSQPSRSFSPPSRSQPSRSFSPPSRSEPSRSFSPPSRSAPSRSMSPPSRSAPSRSSSPPSRSAPSRSMSPSSSGGGRSVSPSRSSGGGGRSSAPTRSSGGGGARRR
jgi:hypothetical protein